jgi:hypothetical protein
MDATSDDLLKIAKRCADKLALSRRSPLPALEDIEDECEDEIQELLSVLQDDDVFGEVDLGAQQKVADQIEAALPENRRQLVAELTDQHTRHVWLQQEAAYHLGVAVGMKLAGQKPDPDALEEDEAEDWEDEPDED